MKRGSAGRRADRSLAAAISASFLLGCFPSGRVVARLFLGPRAGLIADGSLGASRVAREVGKEAGIVVFLLDLAKGALPVLWARTAGCSAGRRGLLGFLPLLANVTVNRGRGASTVAGAALAEDPEALGAVAPVLTAGLLLHRHPQSVLLGYLLLPPVRHLLGRERAAVAWTGASMALVILARVWRAGGGVPDRRVLKERLLYDREPASRPHPTQGSRSHPSGRAR